jgi:hypothetical protein
MVNPRRAHAPILALALVALVVPASVQATPGPGASPGGSAVPVSLVPEDTSLTIGYSDPALLGRLPLVIAQTRGYLQDAGFIDVQLIEAEEPLPGLLNGSLDLAILDARQAIDAYALGLPVQAVAGHRIVPVSQVPAASPVASPLVSPGPSSAASPDATSPGTSASPSSAMPSSPWVALDVVVATSDTVSTRPGTVAAFTMAYVRALQDLRTRVAGAAPGASPGASAGGVSSPSVPATALPGSAVATTTAPGSSPAASLVTYGDPVLDAAAAAGLEVTPDLLSSWPAPLGSFLPFDGGFDDPTIGDGLGSLRNLYQDKPGSVPDLGSFVAARTLHAAQQALGLAADPPDGGAGAPMVSPAPSSSIAP